MVKKNRLVIAQAQLGFPGGSTVKNLPAMQETQVQSLGQEDPLEEGTATHPSAPTQRIPWTEEPGRLQSIGVHRVGHDQSNSAVAAARLSCEGQVQSDFWGVVKPFCILIMVMITQIYTCIKVIVVYIPKQSQFYSKLTQ